MLGIEGLSSIMVPAGMTCGVYIDHEKDILSLRVVVDCIVKNTHVMYDGRNTIVKYVPSYIMISSGVWEKELNIYTNEHGWVKLNIPDKEYFSLEECLHDLHRIWSIKLS